MRKTYPKIPKISLGLAKKLFYKTNSLANNILKRENLRISSKIYFVGFNYEQLRELW